MSIFKSYRLQFLFSALLIPVFLLSLLNLAQAAEVGIRPLKFLRAISIGALEKMANDPESSPNKSTVDSAPTSENFGYVNVSSNPVDPGNISDELLNLDEAADTDGDDGSQTYASTSVTNPVVGKIVVPAPDPVLSDFVIRATMPVPQGVYTFSDTEEPFGVYVEHLDAIVPAQAARVSRYPNGENDVVEIIAHIPSRPAGNPQFLEFPVVEYSHTPSSDPAFKTRGSRRALLADLSSHPAIIGLFRKNKPVILRATAFGHTYECSLYQSGNEAYETRKFGDVMRETYSYCNLELKGQTYNPANPGLMVPHLMGVQVYTTTFANLPYVNLVLRVTNAHSGMNNNTLMDNPIRELFFNDFDLLIPHGPNDPNNMSYDQLVHDPQSSITPVIEDVDGRPYKRYRIVTPLANGDHHFMKWGGAFMRFGVLYKANTPAVAQAALRLKDGLGFAVAGVNEDDVSLYSFENPETARYFPQKLPLPDYSGVATQSNIRSHQASAFQNILNHMNNGTPTVNGAGPDLPLQEANEGPYHNWGDKPGDGPGGRELESIYMNHIRYALSIDGMNYQRLKMRGITGRHPNWLIDNSGQLWTSVSRKIIDHCPPYDGHVPIPAAAISTYYSKAHVQFTTGVPYFDQWGPQDPWGVLSSQFNNYINHAHNNGLIPFYFSSINNEWRVIDHAHLARVLGKLNGLVYNANYEWAKDHLRMISNMARASITDYADKDWHIDYPSGVCEAYNGSLLDLEANSHHGMGAYFGRTHAWPIFAAAAYFGMADDEWRRLHYHWFKRDVDVGSMIQNPDLGNWESAVNLPGDGQSSPYTIRQTFEHNFMANAQHSILKNVFENVDGETSQAIDEQLTKALFHMVTVPMWNPVASQMWGHLATGMENWTVAFTPETIPADGFFNYSCPKCHFGSYAMIGRDAALRLGDVDLAQLAVDRLIQTFGSTSNQDAINDWAYTFGRWHEPLYQPEDEAFHNHYALWLLQQL